MIELTRISDYYYVKRVKKNEERKGVRKKAPPEKGEEKRGLRKGIGVFLRFCPLLITRFSFYNL